MNKNNIDAAPNNLEEDISLKDIILRIQQWLGYLKSKWKIILLAFIIGGIIGIGYALTKKPRYKAELSFALEDDKASGGGLGLASGLASQFGLDLGGGGGGAFVGENLLILLKSRSIVESTLLSEIEIGGKKQTLVELYISFNKIRENIKDPSIIKNTYFLPNANRNTFTLQQDSILRIIYGTVLKNNLSVEKIDKKLGIINIRVISENELFSKLFTELLAKTVSKFYIDTKTKKSVQNLNILQHQTDSVRRALDAALKGGAASADANPNPNPALLSLRVPSQRKQYDVQANNAILTQLAANLELSKISLRKETPLIQIIDTPILPLDKEQFGIVKGFVLGGILFSFLSIFILVLKRVYKMIMA